MWRRKGHSCNRRALALARLSKHLGPDMNVNASVPCTGTLSQQGLVAFSRSELCAGCETDTHCVKETIRTEAYQQQGSEQLPTFRKAAIDVKFFPSVGQGLIVDQELQRRAHRKEVDSLRHPDSRRNKRTIYDSKEFEEQLRASAEESPGKVPRLRSSLQHPLGTSLSHLHLCRPFDAGSKTVAVVGNGPLSSEDRTAIETHDVVVRFNLMNNWLRFREKIDVWIMRYSTEARAGYWGINNINEKEAFEILCLLKGTWLVGGKQTHADKLLREHPVMEAHGPVLMPEAPMNKAFAADILRSPNSYPSTGFVGIQAVLHCTKPDVQLHIYGFNWSKKTWGGHNVTAERDFISGLEAEARAIVHPTACSGMRECGKGDIDASCHWSTAGRYLCLRGKPKKWVDMTSEVSEERRQEFGVASEGSREA